jgi:hypothetical protein
MAAAVLINILFWSGIAIGALVFAALLEVTGGEWAGPLRITAERFRWFLPVSFVAIVLLMWRSSDVYPWARQPMTSPWFRPWFVGLRVDVACALVYAAAFVFCRASRRSRGQESATRSATPSAILFLIIYAFGFSLIAADAIMSLEPRWTSTLFPAYVFTGNVYAGIAAVAAVAAWNLAAPDATLTPARSADMANLLVAAALFWLYLFWSQFLVIWYGNLTAEVGYLMARLDAQRVVAWIVLLLCCVMPAVVFIPKRGKRAGPIKAIAPLILAGMWLERWILIAPDVPPRSVTADVVITAVFGLIFFFSVLPGRASRNSAFRPSRPS